MQLIQDSHFSKKKWAAHDVLCSRQMLYQLSYRGSSAGWVESHIHVQSNTTQGKASQPEDQVNSMYMYT